jgi:hypothetical protein
MQVYEIQGRCIYCILEVKRRVLGILFSPWGRDQMVLPGAPRDTFPTQLMNKKRKQPEKIQIKCNIEKG